MDSGWPPGYIGGPTLDFPSIYVTTANWLFPTYDDGGCDCPPCEENSPAGDTGIQSGSGGVRTYDGRVVLASQAGIFTKGFSVPFGTELRYNNRGAGVSTGFGKNWVASGLGGLTFDSGRVIWHQGPNSRIIFLPVGGGVYKATWFVLDQLTYNSATSQYRMVSPDGCIRVFNSSGKLISFQNPGGAIANIVYVGTDFTVTVTSGGNSWQFAYDCDAGGRVISVVFSVNGWAQRKADYAFNASGNLLTIKTRANSAASGVTPVWSTQPVEAVRYSYHGTGESGLLRHVVTPTGYRQMVSNGLNPDTAALTILDQYAETEYEYDGSDRVSVMRTHGRTYAYQFAYFTNNPGSTSLNVWTAKTQITRPDGSVGTYFFNRGGEVILQKVFDGTAVPPKTWYPLYQKFEEESGRLVLTADAAAIASVNESSPGLVTLQTNAGRVGVFAYLGSGHLSYTAVKEGSAGTLNKLRELTWSTRTASGIGTIYVLSAVKEYRGNGSTDGLTTGFAYQWHGTTFQPSRREITLPVVPVAENGTGVAVVLYEHFDIDGRLTSRQDGNGSVTAYTYEAQTGGLKQMVVDQGTGRLNLTTDFELDPLGRTKLELGPAHDIPLAGVATNVRRAKWTYYKDVEGEKITFSGYRKTAGAVDQIVGPVTIVRISEPPPGAWSGYRLSSRIDAAYTAAGIPAPSTSYAQTSWVRWNISYFNEGGLLTNEANYFVIPSSGYGAQSTNFGLKSFGYDSAGRLNQTTCAGGTIDKTTFNAMGWATFLEIGTSPGNLSIVRANEYNDNGTLRKVRLPVDATAANDRVTDNLFDYRHRLTQQSTVVEKDGGGTWTLLTVFAYDNRDLEISATGYHTAVADGNRTSHQTQEWDALSRRYRRIVRGVDSGGTLADPLTDNRFFDKDGRVAREAPAGSSLTTVNQYDAAGRLEIVFKATGTFSTSDPSSVANAIVMEQVTFAWDAGGNRISSTSRARFDNATGNGALQNTTTQPKARVSYQAFYPDALGRAQAEADYGTNGAAAWSRPATIPARSNTVLVTSYGYSSAGNLSTIVDPASRQICRTYDDADRLTVLVENCQSGSSSSSSSSSGSSSFATDVRTTRFEYTDDGWLRKLKCDNAATGQQVTEWVRGVTTAQGSALYSNRLVYQKIGPDSAGASDVTTYKYNRQQQVTAMTDQAGTAHAYAFDKLARLLSDTVTAFGTGVDTTVNKLEYGWSNRGLLERATSRNSSDGTVRNEVKRQHNAFNQPQIEWQDLDGAVNTGTSLKVQYAWANGSANTIRSTGMTFPNGSALTTDYGSALAGALSRPDALKEGSSTLASFRFLGLGTLIQQKYDAAANTELTMQNGGTGDAGDIYTGLDRFGRLVQTIWKAGATEQVNTTYGRNQVGGVTWKRDNKAHALSRPTEDNFFWYDGLQQVYRHQRGTLTPPGGPPYTGITALQQTENFSYDETGNWLTDTTTSPALNQTRTHNKVNEVAAIAGPAGVVQPAFDPAGNMTTMPKPGAWTTACTCKWDAWNRLVDVKQGATLVSANSYDALFRRTRKTTPAETRDYYYDRQWRCVEERVSGAVKAQYTWSPLDRWTLIRRKRSVSGTLDEIRFCLKDYLDPAAIVTPAGTVDERYSYDAFGPVRILDGSFNVRASSTVAWNFLFHAEFIDTESGLYNYGFRFYNPFLGRWLSRDPIGEDGGLNLYRMTGNDAINWLDRIGEQKQKSPNASDDYSKGLKKGVADTLKKTGNKGESGETPGSSEGCGPDNVGATREINPASRSCIVSKKLLIIARLNYPGIQWGIQKQRCVCHNNTFYWADAGFIPKTACIAGATPGDAPPNVGPDGSYEPPAPSRSAPPVNPESPGGTIPSWEGGLPPKVPGGGMPWIVF